MVRVTVFFIAGILWGVHYPGSVSLPLAAVIFLTLLAGYGMSYLPLRSTTWLSPVSGLLGLAAVFISGYLHVLLKTGSGNPDHISRVIKPIDFYVATVLGTPEKKPNSFRVEVELEGIQSGKSWEKVSGKSLLYVGNQSRPLELNYGDKILVQGSPAKIQGPANPGEFDFQQFLSFKNISCQQFVRPDQIWVIAATDDRGILFYSCRVRKWASEQIRKWVSGEREQAITLALVLGVVEGLDTDLQDAYAASGAMHVLSVSGLHVGIIYAIILLLLKPIGGLSWSRWLVAILSLVCLWAYAFVTGLSPSVLRAVMMFSFMVIARPFGRATNIYNTLAASAFLLLVYDPYLIMSVGFQLSYLAVIGIVYLYKPLYVLWEPASIVWDKIWQITSVSIAAQLATFPLGLFYFHQFPVFFLISNLIVIPLSTAVLVAGIVLLVVTPFPVLAGLAAYVVEGLVKLLNGSVFFIERLPFSVLDGVWITGVQCVLLLGMIVVFILLFKTRKFRFAVMAFLAAFLFALAQWQHFFADVNRAKMIVYSIRNSGALEWIDHGQSYFFSDTILNRDEHKIRFHIRPNRVFCGVDGVSMDTTNNHFLKSYSGFRVFLWKRSKVLWIDRPNPELPCTMEADYIIIGHNSVRSLAILRHQIKFGQLILDSSNSPAYVATMSRQAWDQNIDVYSVMNRGALVINL